MRRLSIGVRLTLWYLAIFALAQIVFGAGMWFILRQNLYDLVDDGLEEQVDDLKNFLEAQKKDASLAKLQEEVHETYAMEHSGDYLELHADDGQLIYRSSFLEAHPLALVSPDLVKRPFTKSRKIAGHPLFAPLLLLVAAGGGYWLSRRALAPVDALVRTAREVSGTNLSSRVQKLETGDELQRLSDTLNEMLDRIESAFLRITQFTADASHELRTPVSLIRTEAELALRRSRGESEYKESLRHILLEAERTTALIEQLLSLARTDSGRESLRLQPVDLRHTLHSVVDSWHQVAIIRNLQFSADLDSPDFSVMGDETLLRRLADILLDNAFKYTASPGSVHLSLESTEDSVVITVQDSGVGIAEEDQSKIFERFFRVDKARSRAQGGAGLGLAIAQWIVTQHRGSIRVDSRPDQGATFQVELPKIAVPAQNPLPA